MKLKKEFLCHTTDQEAMLVPTGRAGFAGLVRGNKTLGIILNLLEKETITGVEFMAVLNNEDPVEAVRRAAEEAESRNAEQRVKDEEKARRSAGPGRPDRAAEPAGRRRAGRIRRWIMNHTWRSTTA